MTESESKTKTCHKTLAPVASADGSAPWFSYGACLGSDCMAWRWSVPDASTYAEGVAHGFCGLAGKP